MSVRAVTFDFWGTLFRDVNAEARHQLRVQALAAATGSSMVDAAHAFRAVNAEFFRSHVDEQKTLSPADAVRIAARELGVHLREEDEYRLTRTFAMAILRNPPEPVPGALEAVATAAQRVPVGVISDSGMSPGVLLRRVLGQHGFMEHFWVLAFSDEVGVAKPQRAMFEVAARGMAVMPSELLHIGDLEPTDIAGAQAMGAQAALFCGVNDRFRASTRAQYTYDAWQQFVQHAPELLHQGAPVG